METIIIDMVFFGPLKSIFGNKTQMSLTKGTRLSALLNILKEKEPASKEILNLCQVAVNSEMETIDYLLVQSCEVAILPPFSGG